MLMRKSQIKDALMKAAEMAEKRKDEYWSQILAEEIAKMDADFSLQIHTRDTEISVLKKELDKLRSKIKESDKKYAEGKMLMQKAHGIVTNVTHEFKEIFDKDTGYLQSFLKIQEVAEDMNRKYLIDKEKK